MYPLPELTKRSASWCRWAEPGGNAGTVTVDDRLSCGSWSETGTYFVKFVKFVIGEHELFRSSSPGHGREDGTATEGGGPACGFDTVRKKRNRRKKDDRFGDGLPPPLDRPPETEQELRRLYNHWVAYPEAFTRWLEWAMVYTDPAEGPRGCP